VADKIITDLQLIDSVTSDLSFPADNAIQTYRATAAQIEAFVLSAGNVELSALDTDIFHGLTEVTPADDDLFPLIDTSDSNLTKKGSVGAFRRATYRSVTTTDAVGVSDETMKLSGASFTSTLPTAVGVAGKRYKYIHAGTSLTQVYTLATTSGQTIGGIASGSYALYTNGEVLELESDGANWVIIHHYAVTEWLDAGNVTITGTTSNPTKATGKDFDKILWRRNGRHGEFKLEYRQNNTTSAAAGSGDYLFALPSNISIDTSIVQVYSTVEGLGAWSNGSVLGVSNGNITGASATGIVSCYDSTKFRIFQGDSSNGGAISSGFYAINNAALSYFATFEAPISGWKP
jgi:hypothetical protein